MAAPTSSTHHTGGTDMATQTIAQSARKRASHSRIRAYVKYPTMAQIVANGEDMPRYEVHNLTNGKTYTVWWNYHRKAWECTCPTNNLKARCKHVQRVMDREDKRARTEALKNG